MTLEFGLCEREDKIKQKKTKQNKPSQERELGPEAIKLTETSESCALRSAARMNFSRTSALQKE